LQLIHKDRLAPLENAPFSTLWARKPYRVAQRFRRYLRATNCYKLSEAGLVHICDKLSGPVFGLDHGVGHFRPLSITRRRHLLVYPVEPNKRT
jgi:hypothetical protein